MSTVCIIIVNYRTARHVVECLESLQDELAAQPTTRVVVVDNNSADGSVDMLNSIVAQRGWNWVSVLPQMRNGGFAFGNNVGIKEALRTDSSVDFMFLLNPDTRIEKGGLEALVSFMSGRPRVGVAGSALLNGRGESQSSAHNQPSPLGELEAGARFGLLTRMLRRYASSMPPRSEPHSCDWVSGASMMVRCAVFKDIGLLDERYFLYFEEVDFCSRARQAGWEVWFVPRSRVVHYEGASTGIREAKRRRPGYWYDSRRKYFIKHYGIHGLILADVLWGLGRGTLALRRLLGLGRGGSEPDPSCFAFDLLWGDLRALITGRL